MGLAMILVGALVLAAAYGGYRLAARRRRAPEPRQATFARSAAPHVMESTPMTSSGAHVSTPSGPDAGHFGGHRGGSSPTTL